MKLKQNKIVFLLQLAIFFGWSAQAQERKFSLEEVKSLALENNKKLQRSQKAIDAANAGLSASKAMGKPTLDGSAMGLYISGPLNTLIPDLQASTTLSAQQVIYAGGKIQTAKRLAQSNVELQTAQKSLTEDEVLLQITSAYWNIVNLKEKVVLSTNYINLLKSLNRSLKNSFDAGLIYKNDLLKVEVKQNEAELNFTKVGNGLIMAKLSLAQMLGKPGELVDVQDSALVSYKDVLKADKSNIEKRPEIIMMNKSLEIQQSQTKLLKAEQKPSVALGAYGVSAFGKNININNGKNAMPFFVGMISVNVPILDWGKRKQKVKEQQFKVESQKLELDETRELVDLEIQNAWFNVNQSIRRIKLTETSLQQAEENLRLNQDRLTSGTVLGDDVLEAQVLWQEAYSNLIDARAEYKVNEAKYQKATSIY